MSAKAETQESKRKMKQLPLFETGSARRVESDEEKAEKARLKVAWDEHQEFLSERRKEHEEKKALRRLELEALAYRRVG